MKLFLVILGLILGICSCGTQVATKPEPIKSYKFKTSYTPPPPVLKKTCTGKPTVIAVIDTGFGAGWAGEEKVKLCKYGHKNFTKEENTKKFDTVDEVPVDKHGHGTHISSIIDQFGKSSDINYCIVILKYYDTTNTGLDNLSNTVKAIDYARQIHADFINYSGGGMVGDPEEARAVKQYIDGGGRFLAAAGNEGSDLELRHYYPAQDDDRVIVVGALDQNGKPAEYSNHGKRVNTWETGEVISLHYKMHGTSQATAIATGKLVAQTKNICK